MLNDSDVIGFNYYLFFMNVDLEMNKELLKK